MTRAVYTTVPKIQIPKRKGRSREDGGGDERGSEDVL